MPTWPRWQVSVRSARNVNNINMEMDVLEHQRCFPLISCNQKATRRGRSKSLLVNISMTMRGVWGTRRHVFYQRVRNNLVEIRNLRSRGPHIFIYMAVCTSYFMYFYVRLSRVCSVPLHSIYIHCVLLSCWECYQHRLSFDLLEIFQILLSAISIGFQLIVDPPLKVRKYLWSIEMRLQPILVLPLTS